MPAIRSLRRFQIGYEATPGTPVAATVVVPGDGRVTENRVSYRPGYPDGVRATTGGAGIITQRGTQWQLQFDVTSVDLLPFAASGIVNATPTGTGPYTWVFTPSIGNADPATLKTLTIEFAESDGITNHLVNIAPYCVTQSIQIAAQNQGITTATASGFGRARQSGAPSTSAAPYAGRQLIPGMLWRVYADTSWSSMGGTLLANTVRQFQFTIMCGWEPDYTLSGRPDLDFSGVKPLPVSAQLQLTLELDAVAASRIQNWRDNALVYIRLRASPSASNELTIDGCYRFNDDLSFSEDGDVVLVQFTADAVYDSSAQKIVEITAKNEVASL